MNPIPYIAHSIYIHPLCILVITHYLTCIQVCLLNNEINKCWGRESLNTSKATAGPTAGLLKRCTTGVVLELRGDSLVPLWSSLERDPCPHVLPRLRPLPLSTTLTMPTSSATIPPSSSLLRSTWSTLWCWSSFRFFLSSLLLYIYTGACILL